VPSDRLDYPIVTLPTEPGWYWYRRNPDTPWVMIEAFLRAGSHLWLVPPTPNMPRELNPNVRGEWRGPIPEPAR